MSHYTVDRAFVQFAHDLADAAGEVARRYFRAPIAIDAKSDLSPVTQADRDVEAAMRTLIENTFPQHGIFGEEHGKENEHAEYQWVLDPIDGTRAFIAGYPLFTTLISLTKNDTPILGIIDQPVSKERWLGVSGEPTIGPSAPAKTRNITTLAHVVIGTTSLPYYFDARQTEAFQRLKTKCAHVVQGGDGYGYAMLASGHIDLFIDSGLKPYDFCALKPVIEGAGGVISDWEGNPLTLHSAGHVVASANKELHRQAIALLQQTTA